MWTCGRVRTRSWWPEKKTRPVLDRFHDSSRVVLLICLNLHSWESMPKYLKVCYVWENVLIAIFAVQMLFFAVHLIFFWCAVHIFGVQEKKFWACSTNFCRKFCHLMSEFCSLKSKFCRLMALVLLPYVKFLKRSTKVCYIFLGVCMCKSLSMDSLLLSKTRSHKCIFNEFTTTNFSQFLKYVFAWKWFYP